MRAYGFGFFQYKVLKDFIPICEKQGDIKRQEKYMRSNRKIKKSIKYSTVGMEDGIEEHIQMTGQILGSMQNEECRIDRNITKLGSNIRSRR